MPGVGPNSGSGMMRRRQDQTKATTAPCGVAAATRSSMGMSRSPAAFPRVGFAGSQAPAGKKPRPISFFDRVQHQRLVGFLSLCKDGKLYNCWVKTARECNARPEPDAGDAVCPPGGAESAESPWAASSRSPKSWVRKEDSGLSTR